MVLYLLRNYSTLEQVIEFVYVYLIKIITTTSNYVIFINHLLTVMRQNEFAFSGVEVFMRF